ncbi:DUF262 domain-containing protein [Polyangium spumosum]|uniref:DUF262 domain-containing protein n=1 Tax=Polyangium spumosum TaxID=889282 RepID=A0A6N7PMK9_9BACT|nr:DUF262 domain-containing protein [Polyangium spumosum]MRG91325.1 DUF262 domain-containing protein [Polyangium spumosum]
MSAGRVVLPKSEAEIEALDDETASGLEGYPLDTVLIRTEPRTIQDVLRRIDKGFIKLDPDFQRDFLWDEGRQSRLIESVLMRIPLPVFYVAEDAEGKLVVVDGLQRLTTFKQFNEGKLKLTLKNPDLDAKNVEGLPPKLRNRFEDGQLLFYVIDAKAPEKVRLDIFDRVNSGVALTRQQMRNALYSGPATRLLRELAGSAEFKEASAEALDKRKYREEQRDREVINRFLAFHVLGWKSYGTKGAADMDEFLGRALRLVNKMSTVEREDVRSAFLRSMERNRRIFGRHAFCKHESADDRKHPFNVALFEVFSVLLALYAEGEGEAGDTALRSAFYKLMRDSRFARSISAATTAVETVHTRFERAEKMVRGVLGDP